MRIINKLLTLALLGTIATVGYYFSATFRPIPSTEFLPEIRQQPLYEENLRFPYDFIHEGIEYTVTPLGDYEVWGLVAIDDYAPFVISTNKVPNAMPLKNVCLIWGSNLDDAVYDGAEFSMIPWGCTASGEKGAKINQSSLIYFHLLASDETLQEKIKTIHKGDQIHLKGTIVDYKNKTADWSKETRFAYDAASGENYRIMMVKEVEIMKEGNQKSYLFYKKCKQLLLIVLVLKIFFSVTTTHRDISGRLDEREI